ncbi:MAG: CvpA family protein [Bacteroidota bacterium]
MDPIDIVLLLLLGYGAYEGYKKGFLMSMVGLFGLLLALILGVYFMDLVSEWLASETEDLAYALPIIAFLLIFCSTLLLVHLAGKAMKKMLSLLLLGGLDSLAGGLLGIIRTGFFISFFLWFGFFMEIKSLQKWESTSKVLPYIQPLGPGVFELLSPFLPTLKEAGRKMMDKIDQGEPFTKETGKESIEGQ